MTDDASTILLVEDDHATRTFLADNLTADGYDLLVADSLRDGARLLETKYPDLAVVDVGLPDGSGLDLVLRGRASEVDRLRGLERGADDYVAKPFAYPELRLRVAALLRRSQGRRGAGRLRVGPLQVDPQSRSVLLHDERVELSQKEFALVRILASDPTRVFTKEELLRSV